MSNAIWEQMKPHVTMVDGKPQHPIKADAVKPVIEQLNDCGKPFNLGMVFPVSTHNYELRYWLAAGGIHPGYYAPNKGCPLDMQIQMRYLCQRLADPIGGKALGNLIEHLERT